MGLKIRMGKRDILPAGVYRGRVEKVTLNESGEFGPAWIFHFVILSPVTHVGKLRSGLASAELKPGWKLDRWLKAITGASVKEEAEFDSDICINKVVDMLIETNYDKAGAVIGDKIKELYYVDPVSQNAPPVAAPPVAAPGQNKGKFKF